jgi:hypothetical protein
MDHEWLAILRFNHEGHSVTPRGATGINVNVRANATAAEGMALQRAWRGG